MLPYIKYEILDEIAAPMIPYSGINIKQEIMLKVKLNIETLYNCSGRPMDLKYEFKHGDGDFINEPNNNINSGK